MNRQHFFYNITRKVVIKFLDVFSDLVVARYNSEGLITKYVKVPVKFAPKTKQWYWEELKAHNDRRDQVLPFMVVNLDSIEYASDRQVNKHIKFYLKGDGTTVKTYINPVPYDFNFKVQVYSEYMVDVTQIIEQVLPSFYPEAYIRITLPELNIEGVSQDGSDSTKQLELRVTYDGSSKSEPVELDEESYRVITWDLNFKVQGYMFTPVQQYGLIQKVIQNYYADDWSGASQDVTNTIGQLGHATVQGISEATDIPPVSGILTDSKRYKWQYEHYPKPSTVRDILYISRPQDRPLYNCYEEVVIASREPLEQIWYTMTKVENTFAVDDNLDYIIVDPYPTYLIVDSKQIVYPTTQYTGPIPIHGGDYTIYYFGITPDNVTTPVYMVKFEEELINPIHLYVTPSSDTYPTGTQVSAWTDEMNTTIYYTDDGTEPTFDSNTYVLPISLTGNPSHLRFKAYDNKCQYHFSPVEIRYYNDTAPEPPDIIPPVLTFSPSLGSSGIDNVVTISANESCNIYYTTDGSIPTINSTLYVSPFTLPIPSANTIKAFAVDIHGNTSTIYSGTITVNQGTWVSSDLGMLFLNNACWSGGGDDINTQYISSVLGISKYHDDNNIVHNGQTITLNQYKTLLINAGGREYRLITDYWNNNSSFMCYNQTVVDKSNSTPFRPSTSYWLHQEAGILYTYS